MNTLRSACDPMECWPRYLGLMRSLTKSFRNDNNRVAIQVYVRTTGQNATAAFWSFTAGFATWPDETNCEVVYQLGPSTTFVERDFLGALRNMKTEGLDERARLSSNGFSNRQLLRSCKMSIVQDTGAVDAVAMRQSCCVERQSRTTTRACG